MQTFYVYEDWTLEHDPRCFYVGKGNEGRVASRFRSSEHDIVCEQYGFRRVVVFETTNEQQAFDYEKRTIIERHTHVSDTQGTGIGCNRTIGAQGKSGRIVSKETGQKISASKKGKTSKKIWTQRERDETSARMSKLHKGKVIPPHVRKKMSDSMNDPAVKGLMIEKVKISCAKKLEDPEYRQKILDTRARGEAGGTAKFTEEHVRKIREEGKSVNWKKRGARTEFCERWAAEVGANTVSVYNIVIYKSWKHIP